MAKPSTLLGWTGGTQTDPGATKRNTTGWAVGEKIPAQWLNWILGNVSAWLAYLAAPDAPVNPTDPANKSYVDNAIAATPGAKLLYGKVVAAGNIVNTNINGTAAMNGSSMRVTDSRITANSIVQVAATGGQSLEPASWIAGAGYFDVEFVVLSGSPLTATLYQMASFTFTVIP